MDASEIGEVVVKREPCDNVSDEAEKNTGSGQPLTTANNDNTASAAPGSLRYVSRRGRPPGGGYSMKAHTHYVSFSSAPLATSTDLTRQKSIGSRSSSSPQDLLKTGASGSSDGFDIRRFGVQGFDSDKHSFRCEGCDVIFSSRDTYAMHMLLRAKNESCVALPTSAISPNPENPTPREKFERELRQQAMITALRNQAAAMSKAVAAALIPKSSTHHESLLSLARLSASARDDMVLAGGTNSDGPINFNNLFSVDTYGLYVDPRQYRRFLEEYGLRAQSSTGPLTAVMEQMSCNVCGELFSNKDALAMHMMFHTREEEKEAKPNVLWEEMRGSSQFMSSAVSSTPPSSSASAEVREITTAEMNGAKKREASKTENRELTAERVAELKRMAIESSLKSPLKKQPSATKALVRPKSVSQDTAVTSSAQTRPLSADDVIRLAQSRSKIVTNDQRHHNNGSGNNQYETMFYKRRRFATAEDHSVFEIRQMASDMAKPKRMRYEGNLYDLFCRSNKLLPASSVHGSEMNPKVCDNHVSSASGPQDSDETSDGNSMPDQESNADKSNNGQDAVDYSNVCHLPYLDAIMSHDAVFIPLGTKDSQNQRDEYADERQGRRDSSSMMQASALDFSVRNREGKDNLSNWCGTDNSLSGINLADPLSQSTLNTSKMPDRNDYRRGMLNQYPIIGVSSTDGPESRSGANRMSQTSRRGGSASDHHDNTGMARNSRGESPSRVGEARYCPHCEILFLDVTLFHLHMGLHNVNNPWQCNTCGLVCSGRLEFNTHVLHY